MTYQITICSTVYRSNIREDWLSVKKLAIQSKMLPSLLTTSIGDWTMFFRMVTLGCSVITVSLHIDIETGSLDSEICLGDSTMSPDVLDWSLVRTFYSVPFRRSVPTSWIRSWGRMVSAGSWIDCPFQCFLPFHFGGLFWRLFRALKSKVHSFKT